MSESFDGPAFVTDVRLLGLDRPDVARELEALAGEAERNDPVGRRVAWVWQGGGTECGSRSTNEKGAVYYHLRPAVM